MGAAASVMMRRTLCHALRQLLELGFGPNAVASAVFASTLKTVIPAQAGIQAMFAGRRCLGFPPLQELAFRLDGVRFSGF
ncbi:hypothetical protein CR152_00135 [Massilia violaceinigra]|uniref:Uncharacterized protein n=1 Tax=Massilia violaceinigra TaxID=2045208 RepID=A0A2D2DDM2_9BURK|nr:hypothetical protein CR152_00135 [Massilia violaceinigra]